MEKSLRDEYYEELIKEITRVENEAKGEEKMEEVLFELWKKKLNKYVDAAFLEYIAKNRANYMLTDVELKDSFEEAGLEYAEIVVNDLLDKDLLEATIDKNGKVLYGLTKKGKKLLEDPLK